MPAPGITCAICNACILYGLVFEKINVYPGSLYTPRNLPINHFRGCYRKKKKGMGFLNQKFIIEKNCGWVRSKK